MIAFHPAAPGSNLDAPKIFKRCTYNEITIEFCTMQIDQRPHRLGLNRNITNFHYFSGTGASMSTWKKVEMSFIDVSAFDQCDWLICFDFGIAFDNFDGCVYYQKFSVGFFKHSVSRNKGVA